MIKQTLVLLFLGLAIAGCGDQTPKLVPAEPPTKDPGQNTEQKPVVYNYRPAADILFVIDDSGSMSEHQANLSKNINAFVNALAQNSALDFHVGVVTTDMDTRKGKLYGRSVRFVTPQTPNLAQRLRENMVPGTSGSAIEKMFDPVYAALSKPLVDTFNVDFYRPDAHLALIFLTDAEDQGDLLPADLWTFLLGLKKGNKDKIITAGALVPIGDPKCALDDSGKYSYRVFDFLLNYSSGTWFDLCSNDYGVKLANLGLAIKQRIESMVYLNQRPMVETISVKFGSLVLPNDPKTGWVYDFGRNALLLGPQIDYNSQPQGTQLEISFRYYPTN